MSLCFDRINAVTPALPAVKLSYILWIGPQWYLPAGPNCQWSHSIPYHSTLGIYLTNIWIRGVLAGRVADSKSKQGAEPGWFSSLCISCNSEKQLFISRYICILSWMRVEWAEVVITTFNRFSSALILIEKILASPLDPGSRVHKTWFPCN